MTAHPRLPEQHEALRSLSAATNLPFAGCGEAELDIPRQAAALRLAFACRVFAAFGTALRVAAEDAAGPDRVAAPR